MATIATGKAAAKSSPAWAAAHSALLKAYGAARRLDNRRRLDLVMLGILAEGRGERIANRWIEALCHRFVDWNEVRVARPQDLAAAVSEVPADRLEKLQTVLQGMYEIVGGLDVSALVAIKPSEARAWLGRIEALGREEVEAILLVAMAVPTLPASETLARVIRRMGLAPRKATRTQAQRLAEKGLSEAGYREFYSLANEHASERCHEEKPECDHCKLRAACKSKGKW